jgi:hypothetical protein
VAGTATVTDWKDAPWLTYINILCVTQKLMDDPLENDGRDTGRNDRSRGQTLSGSAWEERVLVPARTSPHPVDLGQAFATAHTAKPCLLDQQVLSVRTAGRIPRGRCNS